MGTILNGAEWVRITQIFNQFEILKINWKTSIAYEKKKTRKLISGAGILP